MATAGQLIQKLKSKPEHMRQRQHGDNIPAHLVGNTCLPKFNVGAYASVSKHYAFGCTGGARSVINYRKVIEIILWVRNILHLQTIGIMPAGA